METSTRELRDVLAQRVHNEIARRSQEAQAAFSRIENDGKRLRDFVASGNAMTFDLSDGRPVANLGGEQFTLHRNAIKQFSDKNGIPLRYLNGLWGKGPWGAELGIDILNAHSANTARERVLLRSVGNDLRGVLSDQYRRIDGLQILLSAMAAASQAGAVLLAAHQNETQQYVEFLHPRLYDLETPKNGVVTIAIGFRLRNSDFGDGSLQLDAYEMQAVCLNGAVTQRLFREVHLGTRLPNDLRLSDKTYRLDTERSASLITDAVNTLYLPETIEKRMDTIRKASATEIDLKPRLEELPKVGFTKEEVTAVEATLMRSNPEDGVQGEPTLWKFAQSVGAVAREAEPGRRRWLEEFSGSILAPVDANIDKFVFAEN